MEGVFTFQAYIWSDHKSSCKSMLPSKEKDRIRWAISMWVLYFCFWVHRCLVLSIRKQVLRIRWPPFGRAELEKKGRPLWTRRMLLIGVETTYLSLVAIFSENSECSTSTAELLIYEPCRQLIWTLQRPFFKGTVTSTSNRKTFLARNIQKTK